MADDDDQPVRVHRHHSAARGVEVLAASGHQLLLEPTELPFVQAAVRKSGPIHGVEDDEGHRPGVVHVVRLAGIDVPLR
jgi:hypothetical protein